MTHGDLAGHTVSTGALSHGGDLCESIGIIVVNVSVDANTVAFGNGKYRIELAIDSAVHSDGIDTANQIGAVGNSCVQKLGGPGTTQYPTLWKGHDLDINQVAERFSS